VTRKTDVPMRRISSLCSPVAYPADLIIVFEAVYEAGSIARATTGGRLANPANSSLRKPSLA
jgi:hypothetical protein